MFYPLLHLPVSIIVTDGPVAVADSFRTGEDAPFSGSILDGSLSGNTPDYDPDADPLTVSTTPVSGPSHGVLVLNADGTFSYTPTSGYNGPDSFEYSISDGKGGTDTATGKHT